MLNTHPADHRDLVVTAVAFFLQAIEGGRLCQRELVLAY
jgi:hypothetical protein